MPLKILILGLGAIGQRHVRNVRHLLGDGAELSAFRVRRDEAVVSDSMAIDNGHGVEETYGIRRVASLDAGLDEHPDAVLVCTPTSNHLAAATAAVLAGSSVLVEKPLADRWDGVQHLIELVEAKKSVALVAYQWRFHPLLMRVYALLAEQRLGRVIAVHAESGDYLPGWHPYEDYRRMYAARRDQGGGVILSQIHEMDYLYWFFGSPRRVMAMGGRRSELELDVEDTASILMDFDGLPVHVQLDFLQRPSRRTLHIVGEKGTIIADLLAPRLQVYRDGQLVEDTDFAGFSRADMFLAEMRHFLRCLSGDDEPRVSLRDGSQSLAMALAARESLTSGQVVAIA